MKNKKQVKDVEKNSKNKIRRLMDVMNISEEEEEYWKTVLNHRNILEQLHKIYIVFGDIVRQNFDLI